MATRTRRSHHKSRNGCATCKKRRIKCDEAGPPCGQCSLRSLDCIFSNPSGQLSPPSTLETDSTAIGTPASSSTNLGTPAHLGTPQPTPIVETHPHISLRKVELELMHQWSTVTYKSMCGQVTEDYPHWQILLPKESLKHDFLMCSMLATSALEISMDRERGQPIQYLNTALELHDWAMRQFRGSVMDVTESNHVAVFAFSVINMIISLALPQRENSSMLGALLTHYEMLKGLNYLTLQSIEWLRTSPLLAAHIERISIEMPTELIDPEDKAALLRLNDLNESRNSFADYESRTSKLVAMTHHAACRRAIFHLEECYARCTDPMQEGFCLAWLNLSEQEYVQAVQDSDPVSLVIMMHWGVLADRMGRNYWYARSAGSNLVEELSEKVPVEHDDLMAESIAWARGQVHSFGGHQHMMVT